jgi:raffinose/stachyose/melibiose transport system substrate-binding protein
MVGLFNKYSDPDLLVSGTYDQQVKNFAGGKYAFVTQGSWIGTSLVNDYKADFEKAGSFEVGMVPYAFEDGQETILTNGPGYWVLYNEGQNVDAAKAFLLWCATDDTAQKILVEDCGYVPQFKSSKHESKDPFAATIAKYQDADKTSAWHWTGMKADLCTKTGVVFQDYAKGKLKTADDFEASMKEAIEAYYAKG